MTFAKQLEVAVYRLDGATELKRQHNLLLEWFAVLKAHRKQLFTFENAGHSVIFEQFEAVSQIMTQPILPETDL